MHVIATHDGLAIVEGWASSEVRVHGFDPSVRNSDDPQSTYQRFLGLPGPEVAGAERRGPELAIALEDAGTRAAQVEVEQRQPRAFESVRRQVDGDETNPQS